MQVLGQVTKIVERQLTLQLSCFRTASESYCSGSREFDPIAQKTNVSIAGDVKGIIKSIVLHACGSERPSQF